jgi:cell division protein FtsW
MVDRNFDLNMERTRQKSGADHVLIVTVLILTGVGLVTLYSASYSFAERFVGDKFYFIFRQAIYGAAGLVLFITASVIPVKLIRFLVPFVVIVAALLCVLTFVPGIGFSRNGSARWISIGPLSYQPSELVKLALPLYLAHIIDKKQEQLHSFFR